jgi:hypothetical protein
VSFGGIYQTTCVGTCTQENPMTGDCTCAGETTVTGDCHDDFSWCSWLP